MIKPTSAPFIVVGNATTAGYPEGGGHWSVRLQYMFAMTALGIKWRWLEILWGSNDREENLYKTKIFLRRLSHYGFGGKVAVALLPKSVEMDLANAEVFGVPDKEAASWIGNADILWNFCCSVRSPLLSQFKKRALIDLDPGHIQVSASSWEMEIDRHEVLFTVGLKMADADTASPTLSLSWVPFTPLVYLPMWKFHRSVLGDFAPFASVTQWTWGAELPWRGRLLSTSKRDAYLRYLDLPMRVKVPLELAANIHLDDSPGDRELLQKNNWHLVHPHTVSRNPSLYRRYIQRCRAELSCPKPVFRELRTGWFSDRSAAFLASGRPVLAEDTGYGDHIPSGLGLVKFTNTEEAVAGVDEIMSNYTMHMKAARELAEEYFDAKKTARFMIDRC
jgi:hypothetical protein